MLPLSKKITCVNVYVCLCLAPCFVKQVDRYRKAVCRFRPLIQIQIQMQIHIQIQILLQLQTQIQIHIQIHIDEACQTMLALCKKITCVSACLPQIEMNIHIRFIMLA